MKTLKERVLHWLSVLLYIYVIIGFGTATFFNYQYARDNGFTKWLFFGQIVPTLKATVWPYFLFFDNKEKPQTEINHTDPEMEKFFSTLSIALEGVKIIDNVRGTTIPKEKMYEALAYEKTAFELGNSISLQRLNEIYPGLGDSFKQYFLDGISVYIEGVEQSDTKKLIDGQIIIEQWDNWYVKHYLGILKAYKELEP